MKNCKNNALSSRNNGYFYIAYNKSIPGWIKIGITKNNPGNRMKGLSQSSPLSFGILYSEHIPMVTKVEADIKNLFNPKSIIIKGKKYDVKYNHGREWIYYGNKDLSPLSFIRSWNNRGELVKMIKENISQSLRDNMMGGIIEGLL
jgi:hypothetical protein